MPDRVKEAVFSLLGHRFDTPGALPAFRVADVFSGAGSMGLEALSRGARHCTFFERDRTALATLERNLAALQAEPQSTIVRYDGWKSAVAVAEEEPFDLIMLDPPYRDAEDTSPAGRVRTFLRSVDVCGTGRPLVLLHHPTSVAHEEYAEGDWSIADHRAIGSNGITLLTP